MAPLQKLTVAFGFALGLGLAGCADNPNSRRTITRDSVPAVGVITGGNGALCNHQLIAPGIALTAAHCSSRTDNDEYFSVFESGTIISARHQHHFTPSLDWLEGRDVRAPETIRNDLVYSRVARDKAIVILENDLQQNIPFMRMGRLDSLTWRPTSNPEIRQADVSMATHWHTTAQATGRIPFHELHCQIFRINDITEVVATNCPIESGMSGSALTTSDPDGSRVAIAVVAGRTPRHASILGRMFSTVMSTPRIALASTVESFIGQRIQDGPDFIQNLRPASRQP